MNEDVKKVRFYHRATKHSPRAYAPGPGFLDWESQPNPFRYYEGTPKIDLLLTQKSTDKVYRALFEFGGNPLPITLNNFGVFFELAMGLSAWKSSGSDRWALRNNPSSGNLHPTEAYLIIWHTPFSDDQTEVLLKPGVYHYSPYLHCLERRAQIQAADAAKLASISAGNFAAFGLTSIHWREEWKYGARALRYCQHDVGHAIAAARFAAATLDWALRIDSGVSDADIVNCLGLHSGAHEPERPDLLALICAGNNAGRPEKDFWQTLAQSLTNWDGTANRLSRERVHWPQIAQVEPFLDKPTLFSLTENTTDFTAPCDFSPDRPEAAAINIIRQRRSAQRMALGPGISRANFLQCLARTLPNRRVAPFDAFPFAPAVHLLLFVHNVEQVAPGLYWLQRDGNAPDAIRSASKSTGLLWRAMPETGLPLYCLEADLDVRKMAAQISCFQAIAGHSAFSLGMLANMKVLETEGAWAYRRLFWEAGMIGQVLYLEAEASGLRGTGIGCYFDDEVHLLLGLENEGDWQSLYHFTIGEALEDIRLSTLPPYAHLPRDRFHD